MNYLEITCIFLVLASGVFGFWIGFCFKKKKPKNDELLDALRYSQIMKDLGRSAEQTIKNRLKSK